ncbi:tRNA lysidine(34) synthetase TilS [Urechidicola sp. KH5]
METCKVLATVSGGIDSMVLCDLLKKLNINFSIAHCNFNLRGEESDADEIFVAEWAKKNKIVFYRKDFDTKSYATNQKISIQMAARELRYTWFKELVTEHKFDFTATAHHQDDALETFIINLSRGTGINGLTGIQKQHNKIIRPLLPFSKETILRYAKSQNLKWREDQSNKDIKYLRNKIRHQITPNLKELNPQFLKNFEETTKHLEKSKSFIKNQINTIFKDVIESDSDVIKISLNKLNSYSDQEFILYEMLKTYGFTEWNDINHLISAQSGKVVYSKTHRLLKDRESLLLSSKKQIEQKDKSIFEISRGTKIIELPEFSFNISNSPKEEGINIATNKLIYPLVIRKKQDGDFFYPTGMEGKKKISKYFKDQKFSLLEKEKTWVLVNGDGAVIWIINHRQDRRFMTTNIDEAINISLA